MSEFPIIVRQRFWPTRLNELLDHESYQVKQFIEGCPNAKIIADKVIRVIEYPFHAGKPDDLHILNCFHGKWCKRVELDFWQKASETAAMKIGDCEDSSILGVAASLALGISPDDIYEVFGYLEEWKRNPLNPKEGYWEIVGGHAWYYARDKSFGDGDSFHYVESTLDKPPKTYPAVDDIRKPFTWGTWRLVPEILWNNEKYEVVNVNLATASRIAHFMAKMRKTRYVEKVGYFWLRFGEKETKAKYVALSKMWGIKTKPIKKAGLLSLLRWRR